MIKARASGSKVYLYFMKRAGRRDTAFRGILVSHICNTISWICIILELMVWADTMSDCILIVGSVTYILD